VEHRAARQQRDARAAFPGSADTPQFHIINAAITGLWGVLFLLLGICHHAGV
jgi:all-trans-retinol 13,14-reductase